MQLPAESGLQAVADLSWKASSATDQEGLHFYVGSNFTGLLQKPVGVSGGKR